MFYRGWAYILLHTFLFLFYGEKFSVSLIRHRQQCKRSILTRSLSDNSSVYIHNTAVFHPDQGTALPHNLARTVQFLIVFGILVATLICAARAPGRPRTNFAAWRSTATSTTPSPSITIRSDKKQNHQHKYNEILREIHCW